MKRFLIIAFVIITFFITSNVFAADADELYNNFIDSLNVYSVEYNGRVSITRADAVTVSANMLTDPDNKETVKNLLNEVVNSGSGKSYEDLRKYIGIDSNGKFNADTGATALYTVAKMVDAENAYFTTGDGYDSGESYVENYFKYGMYASQQNQDETFKLYGYQTDGNNQDQYTWGHITNISGGAYDDLKEYYEEYVKKDFEYGNTAGHTIVDRDYSISNSNYTIEAGAHTTIEATPGTDTSLVVAEKVDDLNKIRENTAATDNFKNLEGETPSDYVASHSENVVSNFVASFDINVILKYASDFFSSALKLQGEGFLNLDNLFEGIIKAIFQIGNLVILVSMVFTGIRYVFSGISGKASIKESLVNMSAGIIFFYVAQGIYDFFREIFVGLIADTTQIETLSTSIWGNVALVVKILSILGLAAVGLRYMFANADGKMDVKKQMLPVVIGLILIYCVTSFTQFVIDASSEALGNAEHENVEVINEGNTNGELQSTVLRIYSTAALIIQILAVFAMVTTGLRYMFANADTKANIKKQCIILFLGAAIVFGTVEIIKSLKIIGDEALDTSYVIERKL